MTEECLFCHTKRTREATFWETMILVFYSRKRHDWEEKGDKTEYRSGWTVTVCRVCRLKHTVEELIETAKEVY